MVDNVENYMDYSYCSKMFTEGQKTKMRAALNVIITGRKNLWTTSNLNLTGVNNQTLCEADFYTEKQDVDVFYKGNNIKIFVPNNGQGCWVVKTPCVHGNLGVLAKKKYGFKIFYKEENIDHGFKEFLRSSSFYGGYNVIKLNRRVRDKILILNNIRLPSLVP